MSAQTPASGPKPRRRRWLVAALTLSLAFNLLIVGAMTARYFFHPGGWRHGDTSTVGAMRSAGRHLLWSLPRERRKALRRIVKDRRPNLEAFREEMYQARKELADVIGKPVLDEQKMKAALGKIKLAEDRAKEAFRALGREFLENLTPEERARFAENLLKRRWRRH